MPRYPALWRDPRLPERFWAKVRIDYGGKRTRGAVCWLWTASLNGSGYGRFAIDHKHTPVAHRVVYSVLGGAGPPYKPGGPEVDHLCKILTCVNPRHLLLRSKIEHAA